MRCAKDVGGWSREDLLRVGGGGVRAVTPARECIRNRKGVERVRMVKERRLEARTVVGSPGL